MWNFLVKGMSCGHCKKAVTEAIHAKDSKAQVQIDIPSGKVQVESSLSQSDLAAAIVDAGYEVLEAKHSH